MGLLSYTLHRKYSDESAWECKYNDLLSFTPPVYSIPTSFSETKFFFYNCHIDLVDDKDQKSDDNAVFKLCRLLTAGTKAMRFNGPLYGPHDNSR